MAGFGPDSRILAVCFAFLSTLLCQTMRRDAMLEAVPSGKRGVLDLSTRINDKLVPWPGDEKSSKARSTPASRKKAYFNAELGMLEH